MQSCDPKEEIEEEIEETIAEIENSEEFTDISTSMSSMTSGVDQLFGSTSSGPGNGRVSGSEECLPELVVESIAEDGSQAIFSLNFSSIESSCNGPAVSGTVSYEINGYIEVETVEVPDLDGMPGDVIEKEVITTLDLESGSMTFSDFAIENRTLNGTLALTYGLVDGSSQMTVSATNLSVENSASATTVTISSASMTYDWAADLSEQENPLETDFVLTSSASGSRNADGETKSFSETTTDADVVTSCFEEDIFIPQSGLSSVTVGDQTVEVDYSSGSSSSCDMVVTLSTTINDMEIEEEIDLAD